MGEEKFIEEFIQYDAKPQKISRHILAIINNQQKINQIKRGLLAVAGALGEKGASLRAAQLVVNLLNR